jgi:hypothetical protein
MAKRKQSKAALPYLRRIAEDDYVQKQLREAATRLREVYRRGSKEGGKAAEDKKLYRKLREAATSLRRAAGAIEEPPPKPKRRGRRALFVACALTAGLISLRAAKARQVKSHQGGSADQGLSESPWQESGEPVGAATVQST